jgi:sigma-B regulation protein RsbU (phosphoserine phosphatase)
MFVTLFIGVLDLATGHLNYSNAGHNAPLLVNNGEVNVLLCDPNIPVGVMNEWKYTVQHIQLTSGASIFLYTDGLNEAEDISHHQFGMERVKQVAKVSLNQPQSLIGAMTSSVQLFVGDAEQSDDMTMLTVQYTK